MPTSRLHAVSPTGDARTARAFIACALAALLGCATAAAAAPVARVPVLVELFTSEGCSSCPPADAVLARLVGTQPIDGVEVIGLGEHVDYWNSASFRDPYSAAVFTGRQESYARAFGHGRVYTPQAVVGGAREALGSDEGALRKAALAAAFDPRGSLRVSARSAGREIAVTVEASRLPGHAAGEVWIALLEDGLQSEVTSGENAGRTLRHAAVVRVLRSGGSIEGEAGVARLSVRVEPGWKPGALRAAAFVQERGSARVLAAAVAQVQPGG